MLSMHVGSSSNLIRTSDDMPTLAFMAYSAAANQAGTLLDWLFSGNFERVPRPQDRTVRGLDRLDPLLPRAGRAGRRQAAVLGVPFRHQHEPEPRAGRGQERGHASPWTPTSGGCSRDHVFGTFIEDQAGIRLLDIIGEDNVMLECDYPHSDSTWPET